MSLKKCVYCDSPAIRDREIITKNKLAWVFPTNIPIVPGHVLIVPIRCVATFDELTSEEVAAIFDLRKKMKKALTKAFGAKSFNYAWNEGVLGGQNVPHFHLHMLPRKAGDTGITKYEPRKFLYRPGSREPRPESELQAISQLLKKTLKSF